MAKQIMKEVEVLIEKTMQKKPKRNRGRVDETITSFLSI